MKQIIHRSNWSNIGLVVLFCLFNTFYIQAQEPDEWKDDPGARQCERLHHQSAGRWSDNYTPAHPLRYAKDKHALQHNVLGTQPEKNKNYWMPLGPFGMNLSLDVTLGVVSGRVTDIAFVASTGRVYAATANGGLWYSDDNGDSWRHFKNYLNNTIEISKELPNSDVMSCGAIAVSPDGNKLFVGTGEGSRYAADCQLPYEGYSYEGIGLVVSFNKGQSWQREPSYPDLTGHAFFSLAMDPANPELIVGATTNGVYLRVPDASSPTKYSWQRQSMGPENNSVSSVVVTRSGTRTTFFAARFGGKVYQSGDGRTWQELGTQFPVKNAANNTVGRIGLAVQPNNPNTVYALITCADKDDGSPGLFGIYRCDSGANWIQLKGKSNLFNIMGPSGSWQMAFAVHPTNINRLYAGGVYFSTYDVTQTGNTLTVEETQVQGSSNYADMVHPDHHVLKFQPAINNSSPTPLRLWLGNDGGIYTSSNFNDKKPLFYPKNAGLPTFLLENFGQHPTEDAVIYSGTQDNDGLKYSGDPIWEPAALGDCGSFVLDWNKPDSNFMYTAFGNILRYSKNGGKTWGGKEALKGNAFVIAYGPNPATLAYAPLTGTPYKSNPVSYSQRVAYGANKVYVSNQWDKIDWEVAAGMADTLIGDRIKALVFASYNKIYAGAMNGQVYRLTEDTQHKWTKERLDLLGVPENNGGLPADHRVPITSIVVDPNDATGQSIYITLGGMGDYRRVWHFDGKTNKWSQRSGPNPVSWTKDATRLFPSMTSNHPVSMANFKDQMWMSFVEKGSGNIYVAGSEDGNWPAQPTRIIKDEPDHWWTTDYPVNLSAFVNGNGHEQLALAIVGKDNNIYVAVSPNGTSWQAPPLVPGFTSNHGVSMAFYKGKLYMAYVGLVDKQIYLTSTTDVITWSSPMAIKAPGLHLVDDAVNLAVFEDKLFLAWNLGGVAYTTASMDGINWQPTGVGIVANKNFPVSLIQHDGLLYAFYNGNNITATVSADGSFWPDKGNMEVLVKSEYRSSLQTTPHVFRNAMYLGYVNAADQGIYLGVPRKEISPSLPNVQHNTLVVDPQNPNSLYAGSDVGIYYSTDAGKTWMPYSNGLPGVPVNYLQIWPPAGPNGKTIDRVPDNKHFLRASTYGRGMFERVLDNSFDNSSSKLYLRKNAMDRGFYDVPPGKSVNNSPDVKICYPNGKGEYPFDTKANFYQFSEIPDGMQFDRADVNEADLAASAGQKICKDGIIQRVYQTIPGSKDKFRMYAQIQNHGIVWPGKMKLYVLASTTAGQLPDLPAGSLKSWTPGTAKGAWKLIKAVSTSDDPTYNGSNWEQGVPYIFGWEMAKQDLPLGANNSFLFIIESDDVPFKDAEVNIDALCRKNRLVALKQF